MPIERSAGVIIFRKEKDQIYYLLLHYPSLSHRAKKDYWDLPKGHIEKGETPLETAKREAREETGIEDLKFVEGFKETLKYFFKWQKKNILKFVTFYLAQTNTKKVKISSEHLGYLWLPYEKAIEKLTYKNAKKLLEKANLKIKELFK